MSIIDIDMLLGMPLKEIDKDYDNVLYGRASQIRRKVAEDLRKMNNKCWMNKDVSESMLKSVLERTPFPDTENVLKFNINITENACESILSSDMTLLEKIGVYAYVVEIGAREFQSPDDENIVFKNLSAAKDRGFFFTPPSLAIRMVYSSILNSRDKHNVLDPAAGVGVFLAYHIILNPDVSSVTGIEIDHQTSILGKNLLEYVRMKTGKDVEVNVICQNFFEYFENVGEHNNTNLIIMNPPYGAVKVLASDLTDISTKANMSTEAIAELERNLKKNTIDYAAKLRRQFAKYGIGKGTLEYSKLFMAAALELLSPEGLLVAITPSAWLGDETSSDFRQNIIEQRVIHELWLIPEKAKMFKGVNQPTAVSILSKLSSEKVYVRNDVLTVRDIDKLPEIFTQIAIASVSGEKMKFPQCSEKSMEILVRLQQIGKLREIDSIVNARGELDLTAFKEYISTEETNTRLIRGDHIQGSILGDSTSSSKAGYVKFEDFVEAIRTSDKVKYISTHRIAIPQCSYLQKKKRIEAAIVPPECVLANSCDFIAVNNEAASLEPLFYYWMVICSSIAEWQFRIFSYNNHVANKELDELTCLPYEKLNDEAKGFIHEMIEEKGIYTQFTPAFDAFIASLYELSLDEYRAILRECGVDNFIEYLEEYKRNYMKKENRIPQHDMPSLSQLDKVMISYVEPGGNWTSIPETVPSKRLDQIREMAKTRGMVRTTYYSRLKYNQPAYTISTYFNRPGNGANIHPWEDRTLSSREAARLQSFPDNFEFKGSEAEVRTQIGNAVPPLLGYAIGNAIKEKVGHPLQFCDMFAGAGGLSYGLELAGYKGIAALELNKAAASTYEMNHSAATKTIVGDINALEIQDKLYASIAEGLLPGTPWIMVGGPPCQGFSTAGYRDENDIRNKLVDSYLKIIKETQPTIVVMENVPGILSMKKGDVIRGVYQSLQKLGYKVKSEPWVLDAERYGVPQMRKRVIIIASKDESLLPDFPSPVFDKCLGRREKESMQMTLDLTAKSYPITVGEALYGLPPLMDINDYYPVGIKIDETYSKWCRGEISTEELLNLRG